MTMTLFADTGVAVLLMITIYYAAKLSRRLNALRIDKAELQTLVQQLTRATQSAEAGIKGLKSGAEDIARQLDKRLQDAQSLRDDLAYMVDRGGVVADRLEVSLRSRRDEAKPEPARPRPAEAPRMPAEPQPKREPKLGATNFIQEMAQRLAPGAPSRSERDLLRALAGRR
jgi:chromosome segregation ATPase